MKKKLKNYSKNQKWKRKENIITMNYYKYEQGDVESDNSDEDDDDNESESEEINARKKKTLKWIIMNDTLTKC